jgi:autotransporter-associated beta strand protein
MDVRFRRSALLIVTTLVAALISPNNPLAFGQAAVVTGTYTGPNTGGTMNTGANWSTSPNFPSGIGAEADLISNQTATRTILLGEDITLGTLKIDNTLNNLNNTIGGNTATPTLIFDAPGNGPAKIIRTGNASGTGANVDVIRGNVLFNDDLEITVDLVKNSQDQIALNFIQTSANAFTGAPGKGLTKKGTGTLAFADTDKTFSGPLIVEQGRIRLNAAATMSQASAVTVLAGGQLVREIVGDIGYGPSGTVLTLNGNGLAAFPGALRTGSSAGGGDQTMNMPVMLASATSINVVKSSDVAAARMIFANQVSGSGTLTVNARPGLPNRAGTLVLSTANSYSGGTIVEQGILNLSGTGTVGSGTLMVSGDQASADSSLTTTGKVVVDGGTSNVIANSAYLNLTGGGASGVADQGSIDLPSGLTEVVGGLMLGGVIYGPGTYGSSTSSAAPTNPGLANPDEYFSGDGIIQVVPAGVPGDFNGSGAVDAADYVLWRNGGPLQNDFTPGAQAADYDFWRSRFGATTNPGSGSGAGVPEPTSTVLIGILSLITITAMRERIWPSAKSVLCLCFSRKN